MIAVNSVPAFAKSILLQQKVQSLIGLDPGQVPLVADEAHEETAVADGDDDRPVLPVRHVEHPAVHDVLVIVGQRRLRRLVVRDVREVIRRTPVQVQRRRQHERELVRLVEFVYFAVDIQQQLALERRPRGLQPVDALELVPVRIQRRDLEDVLEERDLRGGFHYRSVTCIQPRRFGDCVKESSCSGC